MKTVITSQKLRSSRTRPWFPPQSERSKLRLIIHLGHRSHLISVTRRSITCHTPKRKFPLFFRNAKLRSTPRTGWWPLPRVCEPPPILSRRLRAASRSTRSCHTRNLGRGHPHIPHPLSHLSQLTRSRPTSFCRFNLIFHHVVILTRFILRQLKQRLLFQCQKRRTRKICWTHPRAVRPRVSCRRDLEVRAVLSNLTPAARTYLIRLPPNTSRICLQWPRLTIIHFATEKLLIRDF